jgi:tripartite-type tricarboxylate transporter receptor subunit TctC
VAPLASFPLLLAVHPSTKLSSVKELISLARSKPGVLNYGSAGSGGGAHLAAETFKLEARIDMVHVPYKGTGPAVLDLVAGQVNVMFASVPSVMQHVRAGKLNALAVTGTRRASTLPNIPTVSESGLPGYHMESWFGVMAPAGTPADIISRLNGLLGRIVQSSDFQERLVTEAGAPVSMGVEAYSEYVRNELARWAKIVKDTGARLE